MCDNGLTIKNLDNEASEDYKRAIKNNEIDYELVPPGQHRRNIAEMKIQTFKNHFISMPCGTDNKFPMHLWCCLLSQAELIVNMLRSLNIAIKIRTVAQVHRVNNFVQKPFAPVECPIMAHKQPQNWGTWNPRSVRAWNLWTSMEHHQCFNIWVTKTKAEWVAGAVFFKHQYITNPTQTPKDSVITAVE